MAIERDANGRFARKPTSARPGRTAATGALTKQDLHRHIRDIANLPVILCDGSGRRRIVSMFEAAVWRIATGQVSRRTSPVRFVRLALASAPAWPLDDGSQSMSPDGLNGRLGSATGFPAGGAVDFDTAFATHASTLDQLIRMRRRVQNP